MLVVLRETVLRILYERVPESDVMQRKIVEVLDREDGACIKFEDGEEEAFDLVVGADGVWSNTRKTLVRDTYPPEYKYVLLATRNQSQAYY